MAKKATEMKKDCAKCQVTLDVREFMFVEEAGDWTTISRFFLQHRLLPPNHSDVMKQKKSSRFFVKKSFVPKKL